MNKPRFFEFFAGGGMARAGLGEGWECAFANDFDPMKVAVYRDNWGEGDMRLADINALTTADLPGYADLVWASFPCQDLSLAGNSAGIGTLEDQTRSGAFWALWRLIEGMRDEGRAPAMIVLENVCGILTSSGGRDFATIARCLSLSGYRFGAVLLDGVHFVPQSRPRVFIVGIRGDLDVPPHLVGERASDAWHPPAMRAALDQLAEPDFDKWLWLTPPAPQQRKTRLAEIIETKPTGVHWSSELDTARLVGMMSPMNRAKLTAMQRVGKRVVGTIYKRTRPDETGHRRVRAELRDDQIAGCLRTPGGGSSRQTILVVEGERIRSRLLSPREAARLMGLPDSYKLPPRYNDAYHVAGDGLVVPAVRFLAAHMLEPIRDSNTAPLLIAA